MDDHEWQLKVTEQLGGIMEKLKLLDAIGANLTLQNGRLRELESAYQRGRGALALVAFMGLAGIVSALVWLAKLAGLVRP